MKVLSKLNSLDNVNDGDTRKLITKTSESGAGNVVSSISVSGDTISYTKGVNALTSHQNAFSNVKVGSSTVAADQAGDTLELVAGSNITLTPDTTNDKVTIAATVPTKTSDLTNDSGFITSDSDEKVKQTANTSSNSALRVLFAPNVLDTDYTGNVNKNSNFTYNPSTKALATGGTVDGYKLAAASAKGVDTSIAAASTSTNLPTSQAVAGFVEGKGYTSNTGTITGVSVNGTSVATSGVANITSMPASILSGAIANGVTATTQSSGDNSTKVATTAYVDGAITALPEPMIFKGSLGTGGTITSLPTAAASNEGFTYKVITAGTYASQAAKVGDTFISDGSAWVLIPSGDEPSGTVTSVTLNATSPIAIDDNTAITSSGTRTLSHANSGVTAGTYKSVTVDAKGHVTAGSNPTEINSNLINGSAIGSLKTINSISESEDYTIGVNAFAGGGYTKASGGYSHAEGGYTEAKGDYSHAEGLYAKASGAISHAEGGYTEAKGDYQHVEGIYNIIDNNNTYAHIVGNGENENTRSNAYTLDWNGNGVYAGKLTVGTAPTNNMDVATKQYTDGVVSNRLEKSYSGTNIVGTALWSGNSLVSTVINTQTANGNSASLSDTGIFLGDNSKGKLKISNGTNNDSIELGRTYNNNWYGLGVDSSGVSITGLKTPTNNTDAVNKQYVDNNHSIKDITNGNVYIGSLESGYYNVFAGVTLYASEETVELVLSVGRKAFMYVSHELSDGEDTVSYWILNDETDIDVDASESTAVLNNWGQILYQGVFVDSTGDSWKGSFSLKQADYVTAYDVADNLTTNNSHKVLSARQGYLLNQNKQNTILSGTTNPTSDLGVNGDVYIKYTA